MRRGQILVLTALIIAIMVMTLTVSIFEAHLVYLRTRSIVVREVIGSITADFERALAHVLAVATRAYFNYTRYETMLARYANYGLTLYNKHNFTVARMVARRYLEMWKTYIMTAYSGYGVQVDYEEVTLDISRLLNRSAKIANLTKCYWYYPISGSWAAAKLKLNLTGVEFYGWESTVVVGLCVRIYTEEYIVAEEQNMTQIKIQVFYGNGEPYPYLLTKGFIEIYYPNKQYWRKANITDVTYDGCGNYTIKFEPAVSPVTVYDSSRKQLVEVVPLMIVIGDDRGVLVEASTYTSIAFKIRRRTPRVLYYKDRNGHLHSITRPNETPYEVYTLEFGWDLKLRWLGAELSVSADLKLPPIPFMPIKQLRVNISSDGTLATLSEKPIQYENWKLINWHGHSVWIPVGLADPQMDVNQTTRLVFQVAFPTLDINEQYVVIWWVDDLDAEPVDYIKNPENHIKYVKDATHKDVWHPLYDVEFVDVEHTTSRGYVDYEGVAALVMRDPVTDDAFGPVNLHAFDIYETWSGIYLGKYRPYGKWEVYYEYMRYSWIKAPIRIFAVLKTENVGNVYVEGDVRSDYYATLCIVEIINGTRYIPLIVYIYWKNTRSGYGYWLSSAMGRGFSRWFAYLDLDNSTDATPFNIYEMSGVEVRWHPNFMITHWYGDDKQNQMGRALVLNRAGVQLLVSVGNGYTAFASTKYGGTGLQGSIEYCFWPAVDQHNVWYWGTVYAGVFLKYWLVVLDFKPLGGEPGWLNISNEEEGWKNAYIYAVCFLEDYLPEVTAP